MQPQEKTVNSEIFNLHESGVANYLYVNERECRDMGTVTLMCANCPALVEFSSSRVFPYMVQNNKVVIFWQSTGTPWTTIKYRRLLMQREDSRPGNGFGLSLADKSSDVMCRSRVLDGPFLYSHFTHIVVRRFSFMIGGCDSTTALDSVNEAARPYVLGLTAEGICDISRRFPGTLLITAGRIHDAQGWLQFYGNDELLLSFFSSITHDLRIAKDRADLLTLVGL